MNLSGLFIPLMDPDAGVYASVSKNMLLRNNYWELYFQGTPWLDKPHFPFWITALFFKLFGIATWSYKLPGILFVFLGAFYTYLFAKQHYNRAVALWAVLILLTAQHIIISNNDVRAEPFLTGLVIAAIFHFSRSPGKNFTWHLVLGSLFAACAVMTKGIFTLIPIGAAVAGELLIKKNYKELFHLRWLLALILTAIFIIPELYSLWYQFKSPGIKFFLWDSQFGRFTNTGPIKGKGDPTFFIHTLLWAFLPWSLLMYAALFDKLRIAWKKIHLHKEEWFTLSGSLFTLLVFSFSKFQLPYYANIIFPLLAILTAAYIFKFHEPARPTWRIIYDILPAILIVGGISLAVFYQPVITITSIVFIVLIGILLGLIVLLAAYLKTTRNRLAFLRTCLAALALNLFLNGIFYPDLLKYQSGSDAARFINKNYPGTAAVITGLYSPVYEFYANEWIKIDTAMTNIPERARRGVWLMAPPELRYLEKAGLKWVVVKEMDEFHVTMLNLKFINRSTRASAIEKYYLIKILN